MQVGRGHSAFADDAAAEVPLRAMPTDLAALGDAAYLQGSYLDACNFYERALAQSPTNAEVQFKIGVCQSFLGRRDVALQSLLRAADLDPRMARAREWLSQWYLQDGMVGAALDQSAVAIRLAPQENGIIASRALALEAGGDLEAAWRLVKKLLDNNYTPARVVSLYARMASWRGQQDRALDVALQQLAAADNTPRQRASLHFTIAALLDAAGQCGRAFAHATNANQLIRAPYDPRDIERFVDWQIEFFTPQRLRELTRAAWPSDKPVFVVGMPRSGTSLIEQILASHP